MATDVPELREFESDALSDQYIDYEVADGVGTIVVDRPPLNTYDRVLHIQLQQAWIRAATDEEAIVVVLRAEGDHFCGGADLNTLSANGSSPRRLFTAPEEMAFIRNMAKPTIAAVQGGCVGGGQRFVFPCDLIFCSDDAFFCDPTVKLGIGGIQAPIHAWLYGPRLAKEMLFSGMRMPAQRLYAAGSINRIYSRAELHSGTADFAREVAGMSPAALRQAKRAVNTTMDIAGQHYIVNRFSELLDEVPVLDAELRSSLKPEE